MQIRTYLESDREACLQIFKSNMPLYFDASEFVSLENWLDAKDQQKIAYPNNMAEHFYVLQEHNTILACGGFYIPAGEKIANLVWGMVDHGAHKKGLGKKLLEYRIKIIRVYYPGFKIALDTSQHTFKFFEGLGFLVTKITENAYGPGLHRVDMLLG